MCVYFKIPPNVIYIDANVYTASQWLKGQLHEMFIIISAKRKRLFCGVKYSTTHKHTTHKCHTAWSPLRRDARSHGVFYFFLPGQAAGGLPTLECYRVLSCFKWNSLASTPPPPPATMSQTLTSLMVKKCAWWRLAAINCARMRQLQTQSGSADSGFGLLVLMLLSVLLRVRLKRKWQDRCANKM